MSEWPEALVEKVASAIYGGRIGWDGYHLEQMYREKAIAALDALGLREETRTALNPHRTETDPWGPKYIESIRFVTPWEDVS